MAERERRPEKTRLQDTRRLISQAFVASHRKESQRGPRGRDAFEGNERSGESWFQVRQEWYKAEVKGSESRDGYGCRWEMSDHHLYMVAIVVFSEVYRIIRIAAGLASWTR